RRGKVPYLEGDEAKVDGVMFAAIDSGDCFVFNVSAKGGDYPVHFYNHEENSLTAYAPNFAECIKRFVEKI
ncbi:MAG: SMI1/KNR4 family protein, partial [Verrucomicrobia bacterium]|nr:SMI1/KNR4 family protein [Verrucomicrobiota bacterium]